MGARPQCGAKMSRAPAKSRAATGGVASPPQAEPLMLFSDKPPCRSRKKTNKTNCLNIIKRNMVFLPKRGARWHQGQAAAASGCQRQLSVERASPSAVVPFDPPFGRG